ncbi:MAG: hypothetical protein COS67_08050 [Deltaproteobacteria bacterium CG06_land_8_20_14_3_00_44_19]|nr:MAG: hypothetical protein COS67_08050 [Deltaproteobacteria bacterium CG06_land_8_20_14_3_00_44_19]
MQGSQSMSKELYNQLVIPKSYLWWWVHDMENLSVASVVEGVLSNGDMDDVQKLFQLVGREQVQDIFFEQTSRPRHNYRPQTVNFFKKVFKNDV